MCGEGGTTAKVDELEYAKEPGVRIVTWKQTCRQKIPTRLFNLLYRHHSRTMSLLGLGYMAGILSSIKRTSLFTGLFFDYAVQAVRFPHLCPFDIPWVEHQLHMAVTDNPGVIS